MTATPAHVAALAYRAGLGTVRAMTSLAGGANNRAYRLQCEGGDAFLKEYFRHPADPRDRLAAEFAFSRFAWDRGVRCIPQPLESDRDAGLGLYEFVPGRSVANSEVEPEAVEAAARFVSDLNLARDIPPPAELGAASEACFSLEAHLGCVQRRVDRLALIDGGGDQARRAREFVTQELTPAWNFVREAALGQASAIGWAPEQELSERERVLSPSDFGFHNALVTPTGDYRFLDFEYAGWDDPAKLLADFWCQPAVPIPEPYHLLFARRALGDLSRPEWHLSRAEILHSVYRVKWCCIVLNEFLPVSAARRQFSQGEGRRTGQLRKAEAMLAGLSRSTELKEMVA